MEKREDCPYTPMLDLIQKQLDSMAEGVAEIRADVYKLRLDLERHMAQSNAEKSIGVNWPEIFTWFVKTAILLTAALAALHFSDLRGLF